MKSRCTLYGEASDHMVLSTKTHPVKPVQTYPHKRNDDVAEQVVEFDGYVRPITMPSKRITREQYQFVLAEYGRIGNFNKVGAKINRSKKFVQDLVLYGARPIDLLD